MRIRALGMGGAMLILLALTALFQPTDTIASSLQPIHYDNNRSATARAQTRAITDRAVLDLVGDDRAEVFQVLPLARYRPSHQELCAETLCYQVLIYNFEQNATISAIVDVMRDKTLDVLYLDEAAPAFNGRIETLARELVLNDPDVADAIGRAPRTDEIILMQAEHTSVAGCDGSQLCLSATLIIDGGVLWVMVNATEETIVSIWWGARSAETDAILSRDRSSIAAEPQEACGTVHTIARDGWEMSYYITPSDGLAIIDGSYGGSKLIHDVRLIEWHTHYSPSGFDWGYVDYVGCGANGWGFGFPIKPYGETAVIDIVEDGAVVGFELVQDFRMNNWGIDCKYRYEQRYQFYTNGRWRPSAAAYGRGCGDGRYDEASYRPVMRIDLRIGDSTDMLASWDGSAWQAESAETWFAPDTARNASGYALRVTDQNGYGYYVEPAVGQFGDGGTGDDAYMYATQYAPNEGAADMPSLGACCVTDHAQGPEQFVTGDSIDGENIVLWLVPQAETITTFAVQQGVETAQYCWADSADFAWPCFMGPMFVPTGTVPTAVTLSQTEAIAPMMPWLAIFVLLAGGSLWIGRKQLLRR